MYHSKDGDDLSDLENHLLVEGEPDIIWAEGIHFPQILKDIFDLCPRSIKIIYSKYCEPWLIEGLQHYDACLVDEPWQIEEMKNRHPSVACRVWDKLVDYDQQFFPTHSDKKYDICYVARLHPRKYHELLFSALSKITDRRMSVVLVGSNDTDNQKYLEPLAREAGVAATFTGHVSAREVNNKD